MRTAEIQTQKGTMKIEFFEKDAPKAVQNFIDLAEKGFYDGLTQTEQALVALVILLIVS
jgi:peptidyl-prolyl cis-trans isomerase B (cyclophilin B)